jgi:hypothetical protein
LATDRPKMRKELTMKSPLDAEVAEIGVRLLDDTYMAWLVAESECGHALHDWFERTADIRADAYFAYRAALDREEAAARDLQRLCELARPCCERLARRADGTLN